MEKIESQFARDSAPSEHEISDRISRSEVERGPLFITELYLDYHD